MANERVSLWAMALLFTVACGDKGTSASADTGSADGADGVDGTDGGDGDVPRTDNDHDGYFSDVDCNDNDYRQNPGAAEVCDGIDNDCNGETDEGFDTDGDGYVSAAICEDGDDCDDSDPNINPGRADVPYDGIDQDCDGADLLDADGDGFNSSSHGGNDCDDTDDSIFPGAPEVAKDGVDQDCDGLDLLDGDGDGYDDVAFGGTDCDDVDPVVHPDAFDWMNDGLDADCDGRDGGRIDLIDAELAWTGNTGANGYFGLSLEGCDLDGDGLQDLVITAPVSTSTSGVNAGIVGIWFGANSADWTTGMTVSDADTVISGNAANTLLGFGAVCADLDLDGYDDLLVGSGEVAGTDWVLRRFDGASRWNATMSSADADATFGYNINNSSSTTVYSQGLQLWDVDGDGEMDQLVVTPFYAASYGSTPVNSAVWLVPLADLGSSGDLSSLVDRIISLDSPGALWKVGSAPDLDGDGQGELVLSQGLSSGGYTRGVISFISGVPASNGTVAGLAWASMVGTAAVNDYFGYSFAFGDFDGDGLTDAAITRLGEDRGGSLEVGAVHFYADLGSSLSGLGLDGPTLSDAWLRGEWSNGRLGATLGNTGDLDGDGLDDLLVTEPSGGVGGEGRVRVIGGDLLSSVAGLGTTPLDSQVAEFRCESTNDSTGQTWVSGDFDGDGLTDLVLGGRSWVSGGRTLGKSYLFRSTDR